MTRPALRPFIRRCLHCTAPLRRQDRARDGLCRACRRFKARHGIFPLKGRQTA